MSEEKKDLPAETGSHISSLPEIDTVIDGVDPVYAAKAGVLNQAIQEIGMGRYQWQLFCVAGFGWAVDGLGLVITSLILTPITNEFSVSRPALLTLASNIGLLAGAAFWGVGCDIFGRRVGFNTTLCVASVFALIAASSPNFAAIGVFTALYSFGVGGNLPIDSAIFLEALPHDHQWLLTVLALWWAIAQLIATGVAWPLMGQLTCQQDQAVCSRGDNMGWRYFLIAMGGLTFVMWLIRFFIFNLLESPKYLMGKGKDEDAVLVVHELARRNGKVTTLSVQDLTACEILAGPEAGGEMDLRAAVNRVLSVVDGTHVRRLFASRKLALSTSLIIGIWALIGLASPLYNNFITYTLATKGATFGDGSTYITYRNSCIISSLGVPGAIIGGLLVEINLVGRKGTLAISAILNGVLIYGLTTAKTSPVLLAWNCVYAFFSNVMYSVLYAYTAEIFPTRDRGTGNALTAVTNRTFGVISPIIAMFANLNTSAPVYTSGALFIAAGLLALVLPYESRGKASL
ncbi:hypothetical protein B9479_000920 [Cryptococcus floricola]|uniref:Major facilitator superfamily (MFS) profile domain-containing protein n=1 Tax=Cryptococcus floricola TaxID=2591691 RepID=A0A5D3B6E3_9TREE|nr:hypothetical protein B9479_000920 [Cryptococcus floricola]